MMKKRVVLLVFAAVLLLTCLMSGCGKKQEPKAPTAEELLAAQIQEQEAEFAKAITAMFTADAKTWSAYNTDPYELAAMQQSGQYGDVSEETRIANIQKGLDGLKEANAEIYGENFTVSVDAFTMHMTTEEELKKLTENVLETYPYYADAKIEAISILTAEITLSGDISSEKLSEEYPFVKIDGKWYVGVGDFYDAEDIIFFLEFNV